VGDATGRDGSQDRVGGDRGGRRAEIGHVLKDLDAVGRER
jgi:hypothetical protein